jgi:hypothetical protein
MENDKELIEWILRDKSKTRKDLNHNQKKAYLNKLHAKIDRSKLRKKDKSSRFFVDNEYVQGGYLATLSKLCTSVYMALLVHCNTESQAAFPSITTIQELVGSKNRSSIIKAIRILEGYGIIGVTRADGAFNMVNLYTFQSSELWLPVPNWNRKIKISEAPPQLQKQHPRSYNKRPYRSDDNETLTNLRKNSPNSVTHIGDVLRGTMQKLQMPRSQESVAIRDPSGDTVVRPPNEAPVPVITGNLREDGSDDNVTAIEQNPPFKNGEKRADEQDNQTITSAYE